MPNHSTTAGGVSPRQALEIKIMLWDGKRQSTIQGITGVSQSSISRIQNGTLHHDTPWPTGALGAKPLHTSDDHTFGWSEDATEFLSLPAAMQERIFTLVNAHREQESLEPIPQYAPEYLTYMNADPSERAHEGLSDSAARLSEDRRMTGLYHYWRDLLAELSQERSGQELDRIMTATQRQSTYNVPPPDNTRPLTYKRLSWTFICLKAAKLKLIKQAIISDNIFLIEAIRIIFKELSESPSSWNDPETEDAVYRLMDKLQNHPPTAAIISHPNYEVRT